MRIPQYYRRKGWQRFFAGMIIGGFISWFIFLFMFGTLQEKQTLLIEKQKEEIKDSKKYVSILQEDLKKLNKENKESLLVQEIKVKITNAEKFGLKSDSLDIFQAQEKIQEDLSDLLAKDLESVYKNNEIIEKTIENKTLKLNEKRYQVEIQKVGYFTTIEFYVELKFAD
ncbi:biopolymer transport protein ExbB/TolQ [Bacillus pakistanensis]|uniref:Biopolymer transport protein ExbB/TolQ n=1 Tax=Rossellomorea pakistanensis TaxID=992288 RepID=A0ABS2NAS3_9BACI|nr:sporulation membrane protein YtrI [Bacillus pakistanensis]MBM7584938.1 biopolymer transport protein ExbB/TolQ [Bacillus pakistanensis]